MALHNVSVLDLLHERCRRDLRDKNMLRPMANRNDIIWQQMTIENFAALIDTGELYCRAYGEYADYDETKFLELIQPLIKGKTDQIICERFENAYKEFERKIFISCWYNSKDLSDVVFKVYTKGGTGVAIGTRVDALAKQLSNAKTARVSDSITPSNDSIYSDRDIQNIVCANVQYVPQNSLKNEQLYEPAQTYAPVFLKGYQFQMDNEFRVCIKMKEPVVYLCNNDLEMKRRNLEEAANQLHQAALVDMGLAGKERIAAIKSKFSEADEKAFSSGSSYSHCKLPVNIKELIQYVAVKDDGYYHELGEERIAQIFSNMFHLSIKRVREETANGFMIFEVDWTEGVGMIC